MIDLGDLYFEHSRSISVCTLDAHLFRKLLIITMLDLSFPSLRYQFENPAFNLFPTCGASCIGVSSANSGFILFSSISPFRPQKLALFPSSQSTKHTPHACSETG